MFAGGRRNLLITGLGLYSRTKIRGVSLALGKKERDRKLIAFCQMDQLGRNDFDPRDVNPVELP